MTFLSELAGMLAFRAHALRARAERRALAMGVVCFSSGFLAFVMVRNSVYAVLPELTPGPSEPVRYFFHLNLIQAVLFVLLIYIPAIILLSNAISGDGLGFSISGREYREHGSALLPLWGLLFLIAAPLQYFAPQFLVVGVFGISVGMFVLLLLLGTYTIWAIRKLNDLSPAQALGVFSLSWAALPVYYLLTSFSCVPLFIIMIPLVYLACRYIHGRFTSKMDERVSQRHLRALTSNPQDADAHYQLGLAHLKRGNPDAARGYFEDALKIVGSDPDYHYALGRSHEMKSEWARALQQYEETCRINPDYGSGDVSRELGKGYLQTGNLGKGAEFLRSFLAKRGSDPEGRYWLAVALRKMGDREQMRVQLNMILDQARLNPRFFRRANREWIYRARNMIRDSRFGIRD